MKNQSALQGLVLLLISFFLSATTLVLGAVPLHAFRRKYGRNALMAAALLGSFAFAALQMVPMAITFFSLSVLVLVFNEVEEKYGLLSAAILSVTAAAGMTYFTLQWWLGQTGQTLVGLVQAPIEQFVSQLPPTGAASSEIVVQDLIAQIPSGVVVLFLVSLSLALLFESRMARFFQFSSNVGRRHREFLSLRLPDFTLWLLLASLLTTFYQGGWPDQVRLAGSNGLNILAMLYFFQGLAIATVFFDTYKVTPLWRSIWYVFMVLQLFLFVSSLGFVDHWLDFRKRLQKKTESTNKLKDKGGWT